MDQITEAGIRCASDGCGGTAEVIVASASDVAGTGMVEGVYLVQTGATGVAETFCSLGLLYGAVMASAAVAHRVPPEGYRPAGYNPSEVEETNASRCSKALTL